MSFKDIGNIISAGEDTDKIADIVKGIGDLDKAASALKYSKISDEDKIISLRWLGDVDDEAAKAALGITDVADAASDLADVAANASTETGGLGVALKGLLKAHPLVAGGAALATIATGIYTGYNIYKKKMIEDATEATQVWDTSLSDIQDKISQYKSLKGQLDSGTLSNSEEIAVRQQILDLQNQITATYGEQASGIDLVNGALDTQISKLQSISKEKADENLRENKQAYKDAKKEMTKDRLYNLGTLADALPEDTGDAETNKAAKDFNEVRSRIKGVVKSFEDQGIKLKPNASGFGMDIEFTGDASQAESAISDFRAALIALEDTYGQDNDLINNILDASQDTLDDNQKVLDKYQDNYNAFLEQSMYRQGKGNLLTDYEDAINQYNDALLSGDTSQINEAAQAFSEASAAKDEFLSVDGNNQFASLFADLDEGLDEAGRKFYDFSEAIKGSKETSKYNQFKDQADSLKQYSDQLKNAKLDVVDIQTALESDSGFNNIGQQTLAIQRLGEAWGLTSSSSIDDIQAFADALGDLGVVAESTSTTTTDAVDSVLSNLNTSVTSAQEAYNTLSTAMTESYSDTGLSTDSITAIKDNLSSVISEYDELQDYDLNSLFTNTSKGVKLNNDRLEDFLELQHQMKVSDFAQTIGEQTDAVRELEQKMKTLDETSEDYADTNAQLKNAQNQLADMEQARSQYHAAYAQQMQLFSDFSEWQQATQTENAGDKYNTLYSSLEEYKEMYDKGLVGTDDFKTFAKMLSPSGATDELNFAENYAKAARYLTEDQSGLVNFFEDLSTKTDAAGQQMAKFNEETDQWELNVHDLGEVAQKMGIGEPVVEALFGRAEDYGFNNTTITDMEDGILKYTEASEGLAEAQARLNRMERENQQAQSDGLDPLYNETALEGARQDVQRYQDQLDGLTESMQYYQDHVDELEGAETQEATDAITSLNEQRKQLLEAANGDTESTAYKQAEALKNAIQEQAESSNLELDAELNVVGVKQSTQEELQGLQDSGVISPEIDLDYDKSEMSIDEIDAKIQELNGEKARIGIEVEDKDQAEQAMSQIDSEVQALQNQKVRVQIDTVLSKGEETVDSLLAKGDADLQATLGIDASQVQTAKALLESMNGESIEASIKLDQTQFSSLINAITGNPVEVPVEADTSGVQSEVEQSVSASNPKVTPEIEPVDPNAVASQGVVQLTGQVAQIDTSSLHQEKVAIVGQIVQVEGNPSNPVDVKGNITSVSGTPSNPVTVKGNVTSVSGTPANSVNVKGNITSVTGSPSNSIDVKGNVTEVTGGDGQSVDLIGNITDVTGGDGHVVNVTGQITGVTGGEGTTGTVSFTPDSSAVDAYQPGDKDATVVFDKDSSIPDGYQPSDKHATVIYGLNSSAVDGYQPPNKSATVTYTIRTIGSPPSGGDVVMPAASGTMLSVAHADGTAYNVLNMRRITSAYAGGKVALPRDEKALVNEVGNESIVRDGVWSIIPGGTQLANLKKGDIIFSAAQTEALLKRGKISGHARAYAGGSLETNAPQSLYSAYAVGGLSGGFRGGLSSRGTSSSSSSTVSNNNTVAQSANTAATQANTKATEENAEAAEKSTSMLDWVQRRLTWFSDQVKAIGDAINDFITPLQKTNLLAKQVDAVNAEMKANYAGARTYYEKAQSLGLDIKTRKLVEEGKYNLEEIDTSTDEGKARYDLINEYQDYYDKYRDCIDAVRELRNEQVELFKQWADMPTEAAEKKIEKLEQSFNGLTAIEARLSAADLGGSTQAALVQVMTQMRKESESAYQTARNNLLKAKEPETAAATLNNKNQKTLQNAEKQLKNSVTLTADEKKRIAAGQALSTKGLTGKKKTLVTKYNNALKQANASQKQYDSAHANANEYRNAYMGALNARNEYKKQYDEAMKYYNAGDSLSYQNYLVDAQVRNIQAQMEAYEEAYSQAMKNTQTATTRRDAYQKTIQNIKNRGANYAKRYAKYLSDTQIKQLQSGQKVSLGGLNNKNLLNAFRKYNIDLQNAINSYQASLQQLAAAQESEAEAAANAAQSQAEYVQSLIEAEQTKFENVENHYEKLLEYQKALNEYAEQNIEFWEAQGAYISSDQYATALEAARKEQDAAKTLQWRLQSQLNSAVASGVIKEGSDEWLEMATAVKEAENAVMDYEIEIQNLYQKQIDAKYFELFDHALEQTDKFIDKLSTINSLLKDEMMFDYDTGELTEMGALSIVINSRQLNDTLDNIKTLIKKRQQIYDDAYNGVFGEKKYEELTAEVDEEIQAALKNADAYRDAIVEIIKDQAENELDALYKVIDARKEALKKKKEYYDYDKQLKSQTKEINLLEQQIAALDGVTDAESRAQKARLEAQLKEQQDELDDTVRDHVYELQIDGLDDLKDQLSEDFDEWAYNLKSTMEEISNAITEAVENVGGTASDTLIAINGILEHYGISLDDMGISAGDIMMKHYAKGTDRVGRDTVAITNENGRELLVTKDGIVTKLYPSDGIIPNDLTETLIKMASDYQKYPMSEFKVPDIKVNTPSGGGNVSINYGGSMLTVQGDVTKDALPDLQTILRKANDYTQNELRKNIRRFG